MLAANVVIVVPQHPPMAFKSPFSRKMRHSSAISEPF